MMTSCGRLLDRFDKICKTGGMGGGHIHRLLRRYMRRVKGSIVLQIVFLTLFLSTTWMWVLLNVIYAPSSREGHLKHQLRPQQYARTRKMIPNGRAGIEHGAVDPNVGQTFEQISDLFVHLHEYPSMDGVILVDSFNIDSDPSFETKCPVFVDPKNDCQNLPVYDWFLPATCPGDSLPGLNNNSTDCHVDMSGQITHGYIVSIRNGLVDLMTGLTFTFDADTSSGRVYPLGFWRYWGEHPYVPWMKETTKRLEVPKAISFIMYMDTEYYHYIDEVLPRILQALPLLHQDPDIQVLVNPTDWVLDTLQTLGISLRRLIALPSGNERTITLLQAEQLYQSHFSPNPSYYMMPKTYHDLHAAFIEHDNPDPHLILVVSREDKNTRKIHNEVELIEQLETLYPEETIRVLTGSELDWSDALEVWNSAKVVVAPHGAALINMVWCAPGTRIIELMHTEESVRHGHFWYIANAMNYRYYSIPVTEGIVMGDPVPAGMNTNYIAPIAKVTQAVGRALKEVP